MSRDPEIPCTEDNYMFVYDLSKHPVQLENSILKGINRRVYFYTFSSIPDKFPYESYLKRRSL